MDGKRRRSPSPFFRDKVRRDSQESKNSATTGSQADDVRIIYGSGNSSKDDNSPRICNSRAQGQRNKSPQSRRDSRPDKSHRDRRRQTSMVQSEGARVPTAVPEKRPAQEIARGKQHALSQPAVQRRTLLPLPPEAGLGKGSGGPETVEELKQYILVLEQEKRVHAAASETNRIKAQQEAAMVSLIKENIEKVRQGQVREKERLEEEGAKLAAAKADLKDRLQAGIQMLEAERTKLEGEVMEKRRKFQEEARLAQRIEALLAEIRTLQERITTMEQDREEEKKRKKGEEQKQIQSEIGELELRKEMTAQAIEYEAKIEELEERVDSLEAAEDQVREKLTAMEAEKKRMASEMGKLSQENQASLVKIEELRTRLASEAEVHAQEKDKLQKRFDAEYSVFLERRGEFNESLRLRCAFCPKENQVPVASFLFHVAREHMFDQYKCADIKEESLHVGMLLKILEEKARKESAAEIRALQSSLQELQKQAEKFEEIKEQKNVQTRSLQEKVCSLEGDVEALLLLKSNQREQIDNLITKNNTLQNQIRGSNSSAYESLKVESQELRAQHRILTAQLSDFKAKVAQLETERNVLRQRWNTECGEKLGLKTKLKEVLQDKEELRKRVGELERNLAEARNNSKVEIRNLAEEKTDMKRKMDRLESRLISLREEKSNVESELKSLQAENTAIKEFKSDLSSINDLVEEEMRLENRTLAAQLKTESQERRILKKEAASLNSEVRRLKRQLEEFREDNNRLERQLAEAAGQSAHLNSKMAELQEEKNRLEREMSGPDFTSFDLGLDSLLKAPLDVINLQIDSIDIASISHEPDYLSLLEPPADNAAVALHPRGDAKPVNARLREVNQDKGREMVQNDDDDDINSLIDDFADDAVVKGKYVRNTQSYSGLGSEEKEDEEKKNTAGEHEDKEGGEKNAAAEEEQGGETDMQKNTEKSDEEEEEDHGEGCDCVDCDDVDCLHGFVDGEPFGIKEMMESLQRRPGQDHY